MREHFSEFIAKFLTIFTLVQYANLDWMNAQLVDRLKQLFPSCQLPGIVGPHLEAYDEKPIFVL